MDSFDYADSYSLIAAFKPHKSMTANACPLSHFLLTQICKDSRRTQHRDRRDGHHGRKAPPNAVFVNNTTARII
ncbi:hypothetical protein GCM10007937_54870 [Mesorhizobium albiziae]|nr:hypothetical protein GCM10007937_54870 [Mesorhizobium albiziae]